MNQIRRNLENGRIVLGCTIEARFPRDRSLIRTAAAPERIIARAFLLPGGASNLEKELNARSRPGASAIVTVEENGKSADHVLHVIEKGARARWWRRFGSKDEGFWYEDPAGARLTDEKELSRISRLAIPPGYTEVRIAPSSRSRLQAVAVDTCGRVQYRYSSHFAERQARKKYQKLEEFGRLLPRLRQTTNAHIAEAGLGRNKVLAIVLRLINETYFRLGSEQNVRRYRTFGITSLRNYHLKLLGEDHLLFQFTGKHHIKQRQILVDPGLAAAMHEIRTIEGERLFNYLGTDGRPHAVRPADVNRYIKEAMGPHFSAKDFRTWGGTLQAAIALAELGAPTSERQMKRNIVEAARSVAERLGNTPAVCRSCYIHPVVFDRYRDGVTLSAFRPAAARIIRGHHDEYELEEIELLKLFEWQPRDN